MSVFAEIFVSMDEKPKVHENKKYEGVKKALKEREYTFELQLGRGSYGLVVQAKHPVDDQKYAIKILPIVHGESAKYQKRELNVLKKSDLWKENIVKYYGCWPMNVGNDPYLFIQMELCGLNLEAFVYNNEIDGARIILSQGPPRFYQHIFPQILNGLRAMHSLGLVHRDIHISNILIANPKPTKTIEVHIKIADFGLAREIASVINAPASLTDTPKLQKLSAGVGNELFRAPELATEHYDYKVDLYSAGIVLYFLSRYLEDKKQWKNEFSELIKGARGQDDMCHQDDKTLFYLFSLLLQKDPNERPSADEASKIALSWQDFQPVKPTESTITDAKTKEWKFLAKEDGKNAWKRCLSSGDNLVSVQQEIERCTGIKSECQALQQETIIDGKKEVIEITCDQEVRCMFQSAEEAGKKVKIVVSECTTEMDVDVIDAEILS